MCQTPEKEQFNSGDINFVSQCEEIQSNEGQGNMASGEAGHTEAHSREAERDGCWYSAGFIHFT